MQNCRNPVAAGWRKTHLNKKKLGPNVKQLIIMRMSNEAVPRGGGLNDALNFLSSRESIMRGMREATDWVQEAIELVRNAADPNPLKNASNETIAGELLRRIEEKKCAEPR